MRIIPVPMPNWGLRALVEGIFDRRLEDLDQLGNEYPRFAPVEDQKTRFHAAFYGAFDTNERMRQVYLDLACWLARIVVQRGGFVVQRVPTFRVHLPGNVAVGEFHRDRDYGHPDHEITFWLPLTDAYGSNTIWIEHGPDDVRPVPVEYGQVLIFDSRNQLHGNYPNLTLQTRVSLDFRVIPHAYYDASYAGVSQGRKLRLTAEGPDAYFVNVPAESSVIRGS